MWPFKSPKPQALTMSREGVVRALHGLHGGGSHFALFYANMNGFRHEVINATNGGDFSTLTLDEPRFTQDGISYAVSRLVSGTDILCGMEGFERYAFGPDQGENAEYREDLLALRAAVIKNGTSALFSLVGFDPGEWLASVTVPLRQADLEAVAAKLEERKLYLKPLLLRARAKGKNKYGETDWSGYVEELREFMQHYFPEGALPFFHVRPPIAYALRVTDEWLDEPVDDLTIPLDGIDFEHWCAKQLEDQGWAVRVSQASGDQGVDIEAMKAGCTVAIQCKRYTTPIGNKSVQEAYAGMIHYQANVACVIGLGGFTRSALELAQSTGVVLVDAANIGSFTDLIASSAVSS